MKRVLTSAAVLAVSLLLIFAAGCGENEVNLPEPTEKFYVNDFAGVLSDDDAEKIFSAGAALDSAVAAALGKDTGAQVVAVTVKTTSGEEPADYALRLGREWGVGNADDNNGVVILLATEDREVYIAVGYGLEGALPDSKTGRLIDGYGYDYFAENEFSAGMKSLYNAVVREVYTEYGIDIPENVSAPEKYDANVSSGEVAGSWFAIFVFGIILFLVLRGKLGWLLLGSNAVGRGGFFGGFPFGRGGGGGHFGSGGGFGGFSGGGGSFGGGGAGRGF